MPLSLRRLLESGQSVRGISPAAVREMPVRLCDGSQVEFAGASPWQLANLERDEILALPARMARLIGLKNADGKWDEFAVWDAVQPHTLGGLGLGPHDGRAERPGGQVPSGAYHPGHPALLLAQGRGFMRNGPRQHVERGGG